MIPLDKSKLMLIFYPKENKMENEYLYFMSVHNVCDSCGYDHAKEGVKPIIIMEKKAAGAFCRNCQDVLDFTIITPSMKDFVERELK